MQTIIDRSVNVTGPRDGACYVIRTDRKSEPMYCVEYAITGRGEFPWDMLRSDMAHPISSDDAALMSCYNREQRVIKLRTWSRNKMWRPTYDRWRSFGWMVTTDVTAAEVWR
jgi:hypothetical protein